MKIGKKYFEIGKRTYIMGILNITPDSFSDGGRYNTIDMALKRAEEMLEEGADIIDVGGESTRPGHPIIDEQEEIRRVVPVIEAIVKKFVIPVSVDTSKTIVAKSAIEAGAQMVNDIWGVRAQKGMAELIAKEQVAYCMMHNKENNEYISIINEIKTSFANQTSIFLKKGVKKEQIILDPGIGFAKNLEQNLYVMKHLNTLKELGYPLLLGTSRKSMIGLTLNLPVEERLEGTLATTAFGVSQGCDFVRVHDIKANLRAAQMTDAICRAEL